MLNQIGCISNDKYFGILLTGEELGSAAKREVFEETGVETEFVSVLSFRHKLKFRFDCSDFYFICVMRPLSEDIDHCPQEIAQCRWLDVSIYSELLTCADTCLRTICTSLIRKLSFTNHQLGDGCVRISKAPLPT